MSRILDASKRAVDGGDDAFTGHGLGSDRHGAFRHIPVEEDAVETRGRVAAVVDVHDLPEFWARSDLSEAAKRGITRDNALRFYGAGATARAQQPVAATGGAR